MDKKNCQWMSGACGSADDEMKNSEHDSKKKFPQRIALISKNPFKEKKLAPGEAFQALLNETGDTTQKLNIEKVLPMSQPVAKPLYQCDRCGRKLNSKSGKTNHQKKCKSISDYSATIEDSALTLTEKDLTSVAATDQLAPTYKEGDSRNITDIVTAATSKEIPIQNHVPIWGSLSQDDLQQIVSCSIWCCWEKIRQ